MELGRHPTGLTVATNTGLLTATGAETVYDTTVAIDYMINSKLLRKATVANGVTPVVDGVTGNAFNPVLPDQVCILVWTLDAAGAVALIQGPIEDVDGDTDLAKITPQFPQIPEDQCPIAYTVYQTTGASAAVGLRPGTDNWDATGLTLTNVNCGALPDRPQSS